MPSDYFGQLVRMEPGNGVFTQYEYYTDNRRLSYIETMGILNKLLEISSDSLSDSMPELPNDPAVAGSRLVCDLYDVLHKKNGFFAFKSALHVFPSGHVEEGYSIEMWNEPDLWKHEYKDMVESLWFFGEDIFGEQFAIDLTKEVICRFNPETGDREEMAVDFESWAKAILDDYNVETGFSLAQDWQALYGPLQIGHRLVPKKLFVLGGQFDINNLSSMDAVKGMCWRADIAVQIRDLPDGSKIRFTVEE